MAVLLEATWVVVVVLLLRDMGGYGERRTRCGGWAAAGRLLSALC